MATVAEPRAPRGSEPAAGPSSTAAGDAWSMPRHLVAFAVALVVAGVVAGWLLHWWGPLNPALRGFPSMSTNPELATFQATVELDNASRSPVELTSAALRTPPGGHLPEVVQVRLVPTDPTGGWRTDDPRSRHLPTTLRPGERGVVVVDAVLPPCEPGGWSWGSPVTVELDLRSSWGRRFAQEYTTPGAGTSEPCPVRLPPEVSPPADRGAAVQQITDAYGIAYDANLPADLRLSRIEDSAGIDQAMGAAPGDPEADLAGLRGVVTDVSFDRPDHATVAYRIEGPVTMQRLGEAVLVDGQWKVARATVCEDLAMANVTCPPLPR